MKSKKESKAFATLQMIGRSFFLPVSILPVAGLLLGIGASFSNPTTIATYNLEWLLGAGTILSYVLMVMNAVGSAIFGNLPLIFAMAVALGMSKNEKAVAVLASAISFIIMHVTINVILKINGSILSDGSLSGGVLDGAVTSVLGITSLEMGVFGGIVIGLVVAALHNKFYKIQLPAAISYFAGVRFVPIVCSVAAIIVGAASSILWPVIQSGIFAVGAVVTNSGYAGTFIFGLMERALIPFGLHHVFYIPFWQTGLGGSAIIDGVTAYGAQNIFFAELASINTTHFSIEACRFMTGKYPFMMAGLPGAAYAMYRCAKPEKRKLVGGLLLSAALTSFLTGITEPIEFTFLFIAPIMFAVHCVFAGLSFVLMHLLNIAVGTTFSCGLIDLVLYGVLQGNAKTNWYLLIPVYIGYFALYYAFFKFAILKWNLETPGREEGEIEAKLYTREDYKKQKGNGIDDPVSQLILQALGGVSNIRSIDCCATRLRLEVESPDVIDENMLKQSGSKGILKKGGGVQVIYGPQVTVIKSNLEEYFEGVKSGAIKPVVISGIPKQPPATAKSNANQTSQETTLFAPIIGIAIPLSEVGDDAFSSELVGKGIAFRPTVGTVVAPADCKVVNIFNTKHAIGLLTESGVEILIHIGMDTVKLNGQFFEVKVDEGAKVKRGTVLVKFDMAKIKEAGYSLETPMVITNSDEHENIQMLFAGKCTYEDEVLRISNQQALVSV